MKPRSRLPHLLALAGLGCALAGCAMPRFLSQPPQSRGIQVTKDQLAELVPGISTRADVSAALGSPTAHASFNDNQWIYIGEVTTPVIAGTNAVRAQQVYVVNFDQNGVLANIQHKSLQDAQPVQVVQRTTPSPGGSAGILQQLLGNVGKFSPGGAASSGAQGSAENPGNF